MSSLNLLMFTMEYPPGPGGIGNHAYNLTRQFIKRGCTVDILSADRDEFSSADFDAQAGFGIQRYRVEDGSAKKLINILTLFYRAVTRKKYDLIMASGLRQVILVGLFSRFLKGKTVAILHGHEVLMGNHLTKGLCHMALQRFAQIIAVSGYSKKTAVEIYPDLQIEVINNGVDLSRLDQYDDGGMRQTDANVLKLITVGSQSPRKGQHNVIKALPALKERFGQVAYHVIGSPNRQVYFEELAASLGVSDVLKIHGALDDTDLVQTLKGADIFIMLSERQPDGDVEGFGIAILEGNYFGLPAIGSINCGIEDAIHDGKTGHLVDPHDPEAICEAVAQILQDYASYSAQAKIWAKAQDWDIVGQQYWDILT